MDLPRCVGFHTPFSTREALDVREIEEQLSGETDVDRVFKLVPVCSGLPAAEESLTNEFAYLPAFHGKIRLGHEFR